MTSWKMIIQEKSELSWSDLNDTACARKKSSKTRIKNNFETHYDVSHLWLSPKNLLGSKEDAN